MVIKSPVWPMTRRQALNLASVPWPEAALRIARLRLLARLLHGPHILLALLQTAVGAAWRRMTIEDLADMKKEWFPSCAIYLNLRYVLPVGSSSCFAIQYNGISLFSAIVL